MQFDTFCELHELFEIVKNPINVEGPLIILGKFVPENCKLPEQIKDKVYDFKWFRGRSDWLINPNKKGGIRNSSYTRICPKCLKNNGYFELKWQLQIINSCLICEIQLVERCPKCQRSISPLILVQKSKEIVSKKMIQSCFGCGFDLTLANSKRMAESVLQQQRLIQNAYSENPVNYRYLEYIRTGENLLIGRESIP